MLVDCCYSAHLPADYESVVILVIVLVELEQVV